MPCKPLQTRQQGLGHHGAPVHARPGCLADGKLEEAREEGGTQGADGPGFGFPKPFGQGVQKRLRLGVVAVLLLGFGFGLDGMGRMVDRSMRLCVARSGFDASSNNMHVLVITLRPTRHTHVCARSQNNAKTNIYVYPCIFTILPISRSKYVPAGLGEPHRQLPHQAHEELPRHGVQVRG